MEDNTVIGNVIAKGGGRWEWIIPAFSALPRRRDASFKSPNFGGSNFFMTIFPNGINSNTGISICLIRISSLKGNYSSCTVGLKRANHSGETIVSRICAEQFYSAHAFNTTRRELEEGDWLSDDQLTITIFFRVDHASQGLETSVPAVIRADHSESAIGEDSRRNGIRTPPEARGAARLIENMKELLSPENEDYDVRLLVNGKVFRAHKCILKARSPVFRMMLTHECKEKNSGDIQIDDCDPDCFDEFLLFIYSGHAEKLTPEKALGLYYAADKYDFPDLKEKCVEFMKASLSTTSVCDTVLLAVQCEERELLRTATEYFARNTKKILLTAEWLKFMAKNPVAANELLIKSLENMGQ